MKKIDWAAQYKGKRVLVTGDTGFKGSWLCVWLCGLGARVFGMALPPGSKAVNFSRSKLSDKIRHFDGDVCDYQRVREVFDICKPDMVFHLAAQALVLESYNAPRETFGINVMGTVNVLEAARHTKSIQAVVTVTSDKCYDNKEWIHGYREADPLGGKDPYSASKAAVEIVSAAYGHSFFNNPHAASIATVRAGNVIGGGDWAPNRIVPDCIRALQERKPIRLRNPHAVRPWQHVLEPLRGYLMLMQKLYCEGSVWSGPWNFGPLQSNVQSVDNLAKRIVSSWESGSITLSKTKSLLHEAGLLNLDISKAINYLGWKPALTFEETVDWTMREYRFLKSGPRVFDAMAREIDHYNDIVARRERQ